MEEGEIDRRWQLVHADERAAILYYPAPPRFLHWSPPEAGQ